MHQHSVFFAAVLLGITGSALLASEGPFDGRNFKGRIAWSSDGNFNDEDDWAASPVALAIFAQFGVKAKLAHFDYNSILTAPSRNGSARTKSASAAPRNDTDTTQPFFTTAGRTSMARSKALEKPSTPPRQTIRCIS